ncbi:MAG: hypothetical protein VX569_06875 [Pseudomonadota bacterium]|nr:hypothetical protein [Pseudomonadota bacterium]
MIEGTPYRTLGIAFLMLGVSMALSLGMAIGPAFASTGLPFAVAGVAFLVKSRANATKDGGI